MFLKTTWFGSFLIEERKVVDHRLFPADPNEIAVRYERLMKGEVLEEERELAAEREGRIIVEDRRLLALGNTTLLDRTNDDHSFYSSPTIREEDYSILPQLLQDALIIAASRKLRRTYAAREIHELIAALDDLNRTINLLNEREVEWGKVYGKREELQEEEEEEEGEQERGELKEGKEKEKGEGQEGKNKEKEQEGGNEKREEEWKDNDGDNDRDHERSPIVFQQFKQRILDLDNYRDDLTRSIEVIMREKSPSLSTLTGELLGARLIALAGGQDRLARLPASTIQILGAENAFFRFRKTGRGMPKHGIIYQHPWIRGASKGLRGRIARTFAAKIAMAARIDHFSGRDDGGILRSAVEKRIRDISARPPSRQEKKVVE